jgi:ribosomal protein S18 acetylase RimI-like enzyme
LYPCQSGITHAVYNENIKAIRFYQKRGFHISNIYINAMEGARKIKPEIPKM